MEAFVKPGLIMWTGINGKEKEFYVLISQSVEFDFGGGEILVWNMFAPDWKLYKFRITRALAEEFYCSLSNF